MACLHLLKDKEIRAQQGVKHYDQMIFTDFTKYRFDLDIKVMNFYFLYHDGEMLLNLGAKAK